MRPGRLDGKPAFRSLRRASSNMDSSAEQPSIRTCA